MRLAGKAALVTGAGRGLGRSIAEALARDGARIALTDVDKEAVDDAAAGIASAKSIHLDIRDKHSVRAAVEDAAADFGRLDIIVNNAGFQHIAPIAEFPEDEWESLIATMLTGTFLCSKYAIPHLRRSGSGRVINIASVHGLVASPFKSAYVSAKHGVLGFTKALALEEAAYRITANAICPSYVRTALAESQIIEQAKKRGITKMAALEDVLLQPVVIKRLLEPNEVAELVVYLASEAAGGITGSAIPIDCGWTVH
jgi:3-hydroxybutyrate dehydrogenase